MRFLRLIVGALVLLLVGWAVVAGLTGDKFTFARLGIYLAPHLMMLAAGLIILALILRAWISMTGAALVAAGLFALLSPQLLRGTPDAAGIESADVLTVLTHSVRGADLEAFLRAHTADIIALQEVEDPEALINRLGDLYGAEPLHHCRHEREILLSRYPLGPPDALTRHWQLFCHISLPGGSALVGSLHMPKARFKGAVEQLEAFEMLAGVVDAEPRPMILAGDFNTTPMTAPYRMLTTRLVDAFAVAGKGTGATFPTPSRPLLGLAGGFLAIDHVFTSAVFEALEAKVLPDYAPGADHFPVRVELALQPD